MLMCTLTSVVKYVGEFSHCEDVKHIHMHTHVHTHTVIHAYIHKEMHVHTLTLTHRHIHSHTQTKQNKRKIFSEIETFIKSRLLNIHR